MRPDYNCLTYYKSQEDSSELFISDKSQEIIYIRKSSINTTTKAPLAKQLRMPF